MSVPVYRRVKGSANEINVTSVYRHTVCNCERASVYVQGLCTKPGSSRARIVHVAVQNFCISLHNRHSSSTSGKLGRSLGAVWQRSGL